MNECKIIKKGRKPEIEKIKENKLFYELLSTIPKDKRRKVCSQCHDLGHGIVSDLCKVNIDKNNKIQKHIEKNIDIDLFLENLNKSENKCFECNKILFIDGSIWKNYIWKGNKFCDTCYSKYYDEREIIRKKITEYRFVQCEFCHSIKLYKDERYHFDHLNMFDKDKNIYTMIREGIDIEKIYEEIDKCQILCLSCHDKVTNIEKLFGFTKMKTSLTRRLNTNKITEEEYNEYILNYQKLYEEKMKDVYAKLKVL